VSQIKKYLITELAQNCARENTMLGDSVLDATMGNGNDTLLLAELVGKEGKVYAFDVQEAAVKNTKQLLDNCLATTELIMDSHDKIDEYIEEELSFAMYNLGYLPGGDKKIVTEKNSSLKSIKKCLGLLKTGGMVTICLYPGHEAGMAEAIAIESYLGETSNKDYFVLKTANINVKGSPYLIMIKKLR